MRSAIVDGEPPLTNLMDTLKLSALAMQSVEVQSGYIDGQLACVWGLMPPSLLSQRAYLWLYVTDVVKEHTFIFIRQSQIAIKRMLEDYPELYGEIEIDNYKAITWLRWLGASLGEPFDGRIPFTIRRSE